jgi:hypothetical protein
VDEHAVMEQLDGHRSVIGRGQIGSGRGLLGHPRSLTEYGFGS